jgi:hypothetical protein
MRANTSGGCLWPYWWIIDTPDLRKWFLMLEMNSHTTKPSAADTPAWDGPKGFTS